MLKFVILTTQRTGSTLLWRCLNEHPEIEAHGEMFWLKLKRKDTFGSFLKQCSIKERVRYYFFKKKAIEAYLDKLFSPGKNIKAVGFKLMYNQLSKQLERFLNSMDISVIHLIRKNYLKIIVSKQTARKRKLFHARKEVSIQPVKIKIDTQNLIQYLNHIDCEVKKHRGKFSKKNYLEVYYEDIATDLSSTINQIFDFLNVRNLEQIIPPLRKINPENLQTIIENYSEVKYVLNNTKFENFLE